MVKLGDLIIWILFFISIGVGLWYLFGDSPTLEQAILVVVISFLITNMLDTRETKIRFGLMERSFFRLADDFRDFKMRVEKKLGI